MSLSEGLNRERRELNHLTLVLRHSTIIAWSGYNALQQAGIASLVVAVSLGMANGEALADIAVGLK